MRAAVIAIGDEILSGSVVDSNSAWISERLLGIGVQPASRRPVGTGLPALLQDAFCKRLN